MAELFDREPEDILRDARAHMNPTVYDRGRVSQKLAATRRAWDGETGVNGSALPDPFTPTAKLATALKFGSWKVIAGGMAGLMLATGVYVALPSTGTRAPEARQPTPAVAQVEMPAAGLGVGHDDAAPQAQALAADTSRTEQARPQALVPTESAKPLRSRSVVAKQSASPRQGRASTAEAAAGRASRLGQKAGNSDAPSSSAPSASVANETASAASKDAPEAAPAAAPVPAPVEAAEEAPAEAKRPVDPLIEDLSLLKRAAEVLHRGDARSAQSLLREHARRFPQSDARLERHALAFAAACASGDTKSAEEHRATLLREAPKSALTARVRAGCGMTEP